jgi:hypothetical protein
MLKCHLALFSLTRGLHLKRSVAHTRRGRNGRQEGRERGYYNLHRNLNKTICPHTINLFSIKNLRI